MGKLLHVVVKLKYYDDYTEEKALKELSDILTLKSEIVTLEETLTDDEKEMIEEYREDMRNAKSKLKAIQHYQWIMDILDEAEERYYKNEHISKIAASEKEN